jgi:outer membrane protein
MRRVSIVVVAAVLLLAGAADAGEWMGRVRVISISPNDSSDAILDTGTEVSVDSAITLEVDLTYMFNETWGLEIIAATAEHDLGTEGGALGGADAGSVWVLPPTFTLQYHFPTAGTVHPYVGAGINYTLFYSYDLSDDLEGLGISDVDLDASVGAAGNLGVDFDLGERYLFNLDVKYIMISTDADLVLAAGGILDTVSVDVDPWVFGVGLGIRF